MQKTCRKMEFVEVEDVEKYRYKGKVYDLNIEEDNNYTINDYSVHNSGAGSLVVYLMGITKIDPIKYKLYFERFLNYKRKDPPDIDLDFGAGRPKIEAYLKEKYGEESVAHVISFGRFGVKGALRDVFRIYNGSSCKDAINATSKLIPNEEEDLENAIENAITIEVGIDKEERENSSIYKFFHETHKKEVEIAKNLVGKIRHYSLHAGGVVVTPKKVEEYIPVMRIKNEIVSAFAEGGDARMITDSGLMKFDILGLKACTIIGDTLSKLEEITLQQIINDDENKDIILQFEKGNTFSIFQFEGKRITDFVKKVKPTKFDDLVSVNALYRPAVIASGGLDRYLISKRDWSEKDKKDKFKSLLSDSYGVLTFQEQILDTFSELGGFSLAEADEARHTLKLLFKGKEDKTDFNLLIKNFTEGCHKNTDYNDEEIKKILKYVEQFSQYSFNKSHACSYAMMGYIMMYLKYYYPAKYYSAVLKNTANADSIQDKIKVNQFRNFIIKIQNISDIRIIKPDVNKSDAVDFKIIDENKLLCSLSKIKDVGEKAAIEIEKHKPYSSFEDFIEKVTLRVVNKRVIRALIYTEALKFPNTIELFQKKYKEEIDLKNFLSKQFSYLNFIVRSDLISITNSKISLMKMKAEKKLDECEDFHEYKYENNWLDKEGESKKISVIAFVAHYRRQLYKSKKYSRTNHFISIYDGADILECRYFPKGKEEVEIIEGMIIKCKIERKIPDEEVVKKYGLQHIITEIEQFEPEREYQIFAEQVKEEKQKVIGKIKRKQKTEKLTEEKKTDITEKHERPSWDDYFFEIVHAISKRATCNRGRSGAVVVRENQIIVTGYVGAPPGLPSCDEEGHIVSIVKNSDGTESEHCIRTIHAEQNSILQAARQGVSLKNATMYCTMTPCRTCAMSIIRVGIKKVFAERLYHIEKDVEDVGELFKQAGIELEHKYDETIEY